MEDRISALEKRIEVLEQLLKGFCIGRENTLNHIIHKYIRKAAAESFYGGCSDEGFQTDMGESEPKKNRALYRASKERGCFGNDCDIL